MRQVRKFIYSLNVYSGVALILTACATLKLPPPNSDRERITLTKDNYGILNGEYQIYSLDSADVFLDYYLTLKGNFDFYNRPGINDKISIIVLDERHLLITVMKDGKLVVKRKMKVTLSDGSFMCNRKVLRPFYIALNVFHTQRMRIGCSPAGDLLVDQAHGGIGFLFFIPIPISGTINEEADLVYKRIR